MAEMLVRRAARAAEPLRAVPDSRGRGTGEVIARSSMGVGEVTGQSDRVRRSPRLYPALGERACRPSTWRWAWAVIWSRGVRVQARPNLKFTGLTQNLGQL
jgi:hypothetical protein